MDETLFQGVPDHRGRQRRLPVVFFAAPPAQIGQLRSAESTLGGGGIELGLPLRLALAAVVAAIAYYLGSLWAQRQMFDLQSIYYGFSVIAAAVCAVMAWFFTAFEHTCSYIGEHGFALFRLKGKGSTRPSRNVLLFKNAAELLTRQTDMYVKGIYLRTAYDFRWLNAAGRYVARLQGRYDGSNGAPMAGDAFHFAAAAELAWSEHALARAEHQLKDEGSISFRVDGIRRVRVGPQFIEFHFDGEPVRVNRDEIGSLTVAGGYFSFKHKDVKWYGNARKYCFAYGDMANGKVFLLALDKLMGYRLNAATVEEASIVAPPVW